MCSDTGSAMTFVPVRSDERVAGAIGGVVRWQQDDLVVAVGVDDHDVPVDDVYVD